MPDTFNREKLVIYPKLIKILLHCHNYQTYETLCIIIHWDHDFMFCVCTNKRRTCK